jgi:hypothetical protein
MNLANLIAEFAADHTVDFVRITETMVTLAGVQPEWRAVKALAKENKGGYRAGPMAYWAGDINAEQAAGEILAALPTGYRMREYKGCWTIQAA